MFDVSYNMFPEVENSVFSSIAVDYDDLTVLENKSWYFFGTINTNQYEFYKTLGIKKLFIKIQYQSKSLVIAKKNTAYDI